MSVGDNNHYRIDKIHARHFMQTSNQAKLPETVTRTAIDEIADRAERAMARLEATLPGDFPERIHVSVRTALFKRLRTLH